MPKKKGRSRRASQQPTRQSRPAVPDREPGLIDRIKKNPFGVLLGLIVIGSMVLGLAADIVQSSRPQPLPPTPTLIVYPTPTSAAQPMKTYSAPPPMAIDASKSYTATIITNKGTIKLKLLPEVAPNTVNSFVFLARDGYYDGLVFHRVEDWVVQTGDPTGTGSGGSGYRLNAEFNPTKHVTGTVGMARADDPNSASSQFYIVKREASWLDNQYTVFGQTIEGMDVVNRLVVGDVMQKVTIEES